MVQAKFILLVLVYSLSLITRSYCQDQQLASCTPGTTACSSNTDCLCMEILNNGGGPTTGMCAYVHPESGSGINHCDGALPCKADFTCEIPNTACVLKPSCLSGPLCYPLALASNRLCPAIPTTTTTTTTTIPTTTTTTQLVCPRTYSPPFPTTTPPSPAQFGLYDVNIVVNGDGELGRCAVGAELVSPLGWTTTGAITQISYHDNPANTAQTFTTPGPNDRGCCHFYGRTVRQTNMTQTIDLRAYQNDIVDGMVDYTLSAWIGGFGTQTDHAIVWIEFFEDQTLPIVGSRVRIGPVTAADRLGVTSLLFRSVVRDVPIEARFLTVTLDIIRNQGTVNDGDADNISVVLLYNNH